MKRAALALIVLSMLRIAATWTTLSATVDEPMHVSAGLQFYTQRVYTYQPENPPLPRLVFALPALLGGMDFDPNRSIDQQLLNVFYSDDRYKTNLVLGRAGNLLFFLIASISVWLWARRMLGEKGGFIATLLFTFQPMIAGHAGLATHDLPATAGVALSLLAFTRWLDEQTMRRAMWFGAAFGFAVLCKFSCLGFVPAACIAMYVVRRDFRRRALVPSFFAALLATLFVTWAGYAFTIEPLLAGLRGLAAVNRAGHFGFLFGDVRTTGWWHYFPAAVALKSTLASLVLALFARKRGVEALAATIAILLVAMPSHLNIGVRHVLPLYAPLAVAGAAGALAFKRQWIAVALLVWHTAASAVAGRDAFPYFNEAAGPHPERLLLDSNLDWGQDALRLKRVLREKKADRVGLAILGWHDWDALGYPPHYAVQRDVPSQGWVAVSEHLLGVARGAPWLEGRRYERVGTSIRLYRIQ
ncbi:MAG TPA: glycosyltransferase family 39 protein [Thermoanaerobaculia bacterium]|jgi:4-amino-4-deoxy-L-arabinose transferase-like glycosyltransferase